jgi:hypothetical protein
MKHEGGAEKKRGVEEKRRRQRREQGRDGTEKRTRRLREFTL